MPSARWVAMATAGPIVVAATRTPRARAREGRREASAEWASTPARTTMPPVTARNALMPFMCSGPIEPSMSRVSGRTASSLRARSVKGSLGDGFDGPTGSMLERTSIQITCVASAARSMAEGSAPSLATRRAIAAGDEVGGAGSARRRRAIRSPAATARTTNAFWNFSATPSELRITSVRPEPTPWRNLRAPSASAAPLTSSAASVEMKVVDHQAGSEKIIRTGGMRATTGDAVRRRAAR